MTRAQVIKGLEKVKRSNEAQGMAEDVAILTEILGAFDSLPSSAASILGSKGGNTPVKPGSRPRGRPRKSAISETPPKAVD